MAFTNEGTIYRLSSRLTPNDYTNDTINAFQDYENDRIFNLEVDRDTVANADPATTLGNILDNPTVGVNKQISDVYETEADTTNNNVSVWSVVEDLTTNGALNKDSDLLTNKSIKFLLRVRTYYKNEPTGGGE